MTRGQQLSHALTANRGAYEMGDVSRYEYERTELSLVRIYHRYQERRKALAEQVRLERAENRRPA